MKQASQQAMHASGSAVLQRGRSLWWTGAEGGDAVVMVVTVAVAKTMPPGYAATRSVCVVVDLYIYNGFYILTQR